MKSGSTLVKAPPSPCRPFPPACGRHGRFLGGPCCCSRRPGPCCRCSICLDMARFGRDCCFCFSCCSCRICPSVPVLDAMGLPPSLPPFPLLPKSMEAVRRLFVMLLPESPGPTPEDPEPPSPADPPNGRWGWPLQLEGGGMTAADNAKRC